MCSADTRRHRLNTAIGAVIFSINPESAQKDDVFLQKKILPASNMCGRKTDSLWGKQHGLIKSHLK